MARRLRGLSHRQKVTIPSWPFPSGLHFEYGKIALAHASEPHMMEAMTAAEISRLSIPEKLMLMDALWEDLSATPQHVDLPEWHREELENTRARKKLGLEVPMTLEEVRHHLFRK